MKTSGTSTKKSSIKNNKVNNTSKKVSTRSSSTNQKKVAPKNVKTSKSVAKKAINYKKVIKNNVQAPKKNMPKRNMHSAENNIRLNNIQNDKYVPFLDGNQEEIIPNRIRKVEPEERVKKVKKKKKIKPIIVLKFTFFIGIIIVAVYLMFTLETFNLTDVKVKGNERYTTNNIIQMTDFKVGENVFKQLLLSNKDDMELSYVSKVKYEYSFPSTIIISVKERYPAYIAQDKKSGKYYKVDNYGYLLEQCDFSQKKDEILVEGFVFEEEPKFGTKINEVYIKKIGIYNNIKKLIEQYEIEGNITKINFSNSLTTITLDDKLNIMFSNDSNLDYKVSFLKGIIQKNGGMVEGTIDMSIENPVYSKYN